MMIRVLRHALPLFPLAAVAGCNPERPPIVEPSPFAAVDERLVTAYTGFGLRLFQELAAGAGDANVFLSPASVAFALSMTYQGASAETREAMARTLELHGLTADEVARAAGAWRAALAAPDPQVELTVANSLWARDGVPFRQDFLELVARHYAADVQTLDFARPDASRTIDAWVERSTRGRIEQIAPERIAPEHVLFLINAIYFNGTWAEPFDRRLTRDGTWHLPDGRTRPHPMMRRDGSYGVLRGDGFSAIELPYGAGRLSMYVFLPDRGSSLAALRGRLDARSWDEWMAGFQTQRVMLTMPRFRLEYEQSLNDVLKGMGMAVAFDPGRAQFGGMLPSEYLARQNAYISDVRHKTFVVVNEEGTEAAAATSVTIGVVSMPPEFTVDRPFLVAIRDDATGTVLFLGQIADPQ